MIVVNADIPVFEYQGNRRSDPRHPGKYSYASAVPGRRGTLQAERSVWRLHLTSCTCLSAEELRQWLPWSLAIRRSHGCPDGRRALVMTERCVALAVTSKVRTQTLPHVPDHGGKRLSDIAGDSFVGFVVPAGNPKDVIALLNARSSRVGNARDEERQAALGNDVVASTPEEFGRDQGGAVNVGKGDKGRNIKAGECQAIGFGPPEQAARPGSTRWRPLRGLCGRVMSGQAPRALRECDVRAGRGGIWKPQGCTNASSFWNCRHHRAHRNGGRIACRARRLGHRPAEYR